MEFQLKECNNPIPHIKIDDKTKVSLYLYEDKKPLLFINKEGKVPAGTPYLLEDGVLKFLHPALEDRIVGTYEVNDGTYYFDVDLEKVI